MGIGFLKGGGTFAALLCCVCWYFGCKYGCSNSLEITTAIAIVVIGIWSAGKVEAAWGKDSSKIVIDEAAGMCVSLLFLPLHLKYIVTAFVLFRFFDIAKPLFIRRSERLPRGWGVMADDLLAGIYTNLVVQGVILTNLL
ncbi:MAG TPA: phosphatidylglycerophosphatase A [Puia sp.]|jgi:phosphatidylglycerophosphatase A|nr:phosphatidylglycerophosphatase A [Puia sp.]